MATGIGIEPAMRKPSHPHPDRYGEDAWSAFSMGLPSRPLYRYQLAYEADLVSSYANAS